MLKTTIRKVGVGIRGPRLRDSCFMSKIRPRGLENATFDDCPIWPGAEAALEAGRNLTMAELEAAFAEAERQGAIGGAGEDLDRLFGR